jgi:hypothetical protein
VLKVELRIVQTGAAGRISAERIVQRVIEHREAARQQSLI